MLKTTRNIHGNRKAAKLLSAVVRVSLMIAVSLAAQQTLGLFPAPRVIYAEESPEQKLVRLPDSRPQQSYDLKIRESLNLQKDFGNPASALRILDQLSNKIEKKVKPRTKFNKKQAIEALKVIGGVLKNEGNFEYRENNLLIEGLKTQKNGKRFIDCDDYSSIYLVAAERLGLPLVPVHTPRHVFLMCWLDENTRFYWEPTIAEERDISFYKDLLNIKEGSSFPKVLNEGEFEAIQFCNLGVAWLEKHEYAKAAEYFKSAIRLNPLYVAAHNNLGVAYAKQGNFAQAMECYSEAISISPEFAAGFINTGVAFYRQGNLQSAVECFEKVIERDPTCDKANSYKVVALIKKGDRSEAFRFLDKLHELKRRTLTPRD